MMIEFILSSYCYLMVRALKDNGDQSTPEKNRHHSPCDGSIVSKNTTKVVTFLKYLCQLIASLSFLCCMYLSQSK